MGLPPSELPGNSPSEMPGDAPAEGSPDTPQEYPSESPPEAEPETPTELPVGQPPPESLAAGQLARDPMMILNAQITPVSRLDQLRDAIATAPPGDPVLIEVHRQGTPFLLALP